jgi:teichuronic acid biosynthesis glycosyltransferase TuaG
MQNLKISSQYVDELVSIIMPAYKAATVISESIQSVVDQTYQQWELIITDDRSPDNTVEVVRNWCKSDGRIKLIEAPANGGPAAARNLSLGQARGRWVAFLDSDDIWLPQKLEIQLKFHLQQQAKISYTEFRRIQADGTGVGRLIKIPTKLTYRQLLGNTGIATSTVLVDRKLTGTFSMKKMFYDDFGCWLDILRSGGWASGLREDLMRYRVMGGSVSRNKRRSAVEVWKTYRNVEELGLLVSSIHFAGYAIRALLKYRKF